jgi:hypothetical protein
VCEHNVMRARVVSCGHAYQHTVELVRGVVVLIVQVLSVDPGDDE